MSQTPTFLQSSLPLSATEPRLREKLRRRPIPRRRIQLPPNVARQLWEIFQAQQIFEGPHQARFEEAFARTIGTRSAIGVASARVGLYLTLQAFGFEPGDEILCPAYTFHALPEIIRASGLVPVFIDAAPNTYNINPNLIEASITPKTKALLITHLFGQPCNLESIHSIARRHKLRLIEDCAHACGAEYQNKRVGSFGDVGLFSFGPGKNLPCFRGGMVTTNDPAIADQLRNLVDKGAPPTFPQLLREITKTLGLAWGTNPFGFRFVGYPLLRFIETLFPGASDRLMEESIKPSNRFLPRAIRLANLQAALGLEQLPFLDERHSARRKNAELLNEAFIDLTQIQLPRTLPQTNPIYLYYRVLVENRNPFRRKLLQLGIDSKRDDMSNCGGAEFPVAARLARESVELPNGPDLKKIELDQIIDAVRRVVSQPAMTRVKSVTPTPMSTLRGK